MLDKQVIPIGFEGGLDTKTDEKLVMPGRLTLLENGIRKSGKAIIKRNGYSKLSQRVIGSSSSISSGSGLNVFGDELIEISNNRLYSYSSASMGWVDKGPAYSVIVGNQQVARNSAQQTSPDMAINNGICVYAWADSRGGVRASVIELATGAQFQSDVQLNASAVNPKVVAIGQYFFVFYTQGTALKSRRMSFSAPSAFESEVQLENDVNATYPFYDVVPFGNRVFFVYRNASQMKFGYYIIDSNTGPYVASTTDGYPNVTAFAESPDNCLSCVKYDTDNRVYLLWHNNTNGTRYILINEDFTNAFSAQTLDATTSPITSRITGAAYNAHQVQVFYEVFASASYNHYVKTCLVDDTGSGSTPAVIIRSVGLASKAWVFGATAYCNTAFDSTLQATYFTIDQSGNVLAKILSTQAGGLPATQSLPQVVVLSTSQYGWPAQIKTKFVSEGNTTYTQTGISLTTIDYNHANAYLSAQMGENIHFVGGYLSMYDGASVVEHGFHLFPENVTASGSTGSGSMSDGVYQYYVVWEWIDNKGQTHRSAPYPVPQVTLSGGTSTQKVTLTIPTLRITSKKGTRSNIVAAVYRTQNALTTPYKVSSTSSPTYNDTTADTITFVDTLADTSIASNEILYTTGGVLDNISAPACSIIDVYENRMVVSGLENPLAFWYSKSRAEGEGVAFSDSFVMLVDPLGGPITAVKMMDDKILLFKDSLIFYVTGTGPLDTGQQNNYSEAMLVTSDAGCPYANSIAMMPLGVMFKSNKGVYLIDRSLQMGYIGADVEAYNSQSVTGASLIENVNQVRFITDSGSALVYDYYFKQWSTFTNHEGIDSVMWNGSYAYLRNDGSVFVEQPGYFLDDNLEFRLRIGTAWLKMAGLQGFQRIKRYAILGNYKSPHILQVSIGYDYDSTFSDVMTFNAGAVVGSNYYGQGTPYGADLVYGGVADGVYQFRGHLRKQKCEAIRFLFEDVTAGTPGESYSLSDLSIEVGIKRGIMKLRAAKSLG